MIDKPTKNIQTLADMFAKSQDIADIDRGVLNGLAALTGVEPDSVYRAYKAGGPLAIVIGRLFGLSNSPSRSVGRPKGNLRAVLEAHNIVTEFMDQGLSRPEAINRARAELQKRGFNNGRRPHQAYSKGHVERLLRRYHELWLDDLDA